MNLGHLNCLNTIHFSILHIILLSNNNCTYKDWETATLRDFFVMSDLSSAKQPSKESSQNATVVIPLLPIQEGHCLTLVKVYAQIVMWMLYSIRFKGLNFAFLCSCFLNYLLEWQCRPWSDCSLRPLLFAYAIVSETLAYKILGH